MLRICHQLYKKAASESDLIRQKQEIRSLSYRIANIRLVEIYPVLFKSQLHI